jgi:hypothetical protein
MQKIFLIPALKRQLAIKFGCTVQFVYRALNGKVDTFLAAQVRDEAIKMGGVKERRTIAINGVPIGEGLNNKLTRKETFK